MPAKRVFPSIRPAPFMNKVLIIGAGGVGNVVAHKCAMVPEVFGEITLASRTVSKCDKGHISFRDEGKRVWYRNVRIKELGQP